MTEFYTNFGKVMLCFRQYEEQFWIIKVRSNRFNFRRIFRIYGKELRVGRVKTVLGDDNSSIIDTNILLRFLTDDDKAKAAKCEGLFQSAINGAERLLITDVCF